MAKLTYAQVRSAASALIKERHQEDGSKIKVLIYKDAGGDFNMKVLRDGCTVCYTGIKAVVLFDTKGNVVTEVSRETISAILEEYKINMVYYKGT